MEITDFTTEMNRRYAEMESLVAELRQQNQALRQENFEIKIESLETAYNATTSLIDGLNIARAALASGFTAPGVPSLRWVEALLQKQRANHERLFVMAQSFAFKNGFVVRMDQDPQLRNFVKFRLLKKFEVL